MLISDFKPDFELGDGIIKNLDIRFIGPRFTLKIGFILDTHWNEGKSKLEIIFPSVTKIENLKVDCNIIGGSSFIFTKMDENLYKCELDIIGGNLSFLTENTIKISNI